MADALRSAGRSQDKSATNCAGVQEFGACAGQQLLDNLHASVPKAVDMPTLRSAFSHHDLIIELVALNQRDLLEVTREDGCVSNPDMLAPSTTACLRKCDMKKESSES